MAFDVHADAQVDNCYWIALEEAKQPVWTGSVLLGENIRQLTAEEFVSETLVDDLNRVAEGIDDAYIWQMGEKHPVFASPAAISIENITSDAVPVISPSFNLYSQRVSSDYRGVIVSHGRKMIRK